MGSHKTPLGFWINAYCFLTMMGAFYLGASAFFNLLAISAELESSEVNSWWHLLPSMMLIAVALLSIHLVYRLIVHRNLLTLYLVRSYQLLDVMVSLFLFVQLLNKEALSFFVIFELLTNVLWLAFFFRAGQVLLIYGGSRSTHKVEFPLRVKKSGSSMFLILYCVCLLITALLFYVTALSPDLVAIESWSGQLVFLFLALLDVFILYRLFNVFNHNTLNCLRIRGGMGVIYALFFLFYEPSPALFYLHSILILLAMTFALYFFVSSDLKQIYADESAASEEVSATFWLFLYSTQTLLSALATLLLVLADKWLFEIMPMSFLIKGLYVLMSALGLYGVYRLFYQRNRITLNYIRAFQFCLIVVNVLILNSQGEETGNGTFTMTLDYLSLIGFTAYFFFSKRMRVRYS